MREGKKKKTVEKVQKYKQKEGKTRVDSLSACAICFSFLSCL
jgi:RNase H-fold protein (predicted Holliday junction resolvase)